MEKEKNKFRCPYNEAVSCSLEKPCLGCKYLIEAPIKKASKPNLYKSKLVQCMQCGQPLEVEEALAGMGVMCADCARVWLMGYGLEKAYGRKQRINYTMC